MNAPSSLPPPPAYRDRSTGLMVFGILEIVLGGFCLLVLPLMIFGQVMAARRTGSEFDAMLAAPTLLTFLALAGGLIWLGIGSIQARRWARALLLCLGGMGLVVGVVSLCVMVPILGSMDQVFRQQDRPVPPGAVLIAKAIAVVSVVVMYIIIPGALVLFYRSENVRLTCEHRDPVVRWTDRCPLPVLALCLLQTYGAIYVMLIPRFCGAVPLAGFLVTGWPARLVWFGFAGVSLYAARGFYHLDRRAWAIYSIAVVAFGLSSTVTFLRIDILDYYRAVGLPPRQLAQIAAGPLMQGHLIIWISLLTLVFFGGYLLYLRRYFFGTDQRTVIA